jgi:hypothetical protein
MDGKDRRRLCLSPRWEGAATAVLVAWMERSRDGGAHRLDGEEERCRRKSSDSEAGEKKGDGEAGGKKGDVAVFAWTGERHGGAASGVGRWGSLTRGKCRDGVDLPCRMGSQTPCNFGPGPNGAAGVRPKERPGIHPGFYVPKGALRFFQDFPCTIVEISACLQPMFPVIALKPCLD